MYPTSVASFSNYSISVVVKSTNITYNVPEISTSWEVVLLFIVIFNSLAIFGNSIILITIIVFSAFRRPVNYLVANLSFASVLCALSLVFRGLENTYGVWNYSSVLCFILGTCHRVPHNVEAFTVMNIALDRHRLLNHPLNRETKCLAWKKIFTVWLAALALDIPRGFYHIYDPTVSTVYKCKKVFLLRNKNIHFTYFILHFILAYILPTLVLLREFINIRSHLMYLTLCNIQNTSRNISKRMQLLRGAWILTAIYFSFNIPQVVLNVVHEFILPLWPVKVTGLIQVSRYAFYIFATANSNSYPIFFYLTSTELRNKLRRIGNLRQ